MNEVKIILTILKKIMREQLQTNKKMFDKDVALELGIKSSTLASYKSRNITPYKAILTYCHNNKIDVVKILFSESKPIIKYSSKTPNKKGYVRIKYFRNLDVYNRYLDLD